MKYLFIFIPLIFGCSHSPKRSFTQDSGVASKPFLIQMGQINNHPYKGTALQMGDSLIVVAENWVNDTQLPFESHLVSNKIHQDQVVEKKILFQEIDRYFYNPTFVTIQTNNYIYFNSFNPLTQTATFERSQFDGEKFETPEVLQLSENLRGQFRPWIFVAVSNQGQISLTYEWKDSLTKKNHLRMATSLDGLHFTDIREVAIGAMARSDFFADGRRLVTYQNGNPENMIDYYTIAKDIFTADTFKQVSVQKDVHDVVPFKRADGKIDLYYIATGDGPAFSTFRRYVDENGRLGPEQELTQKVDGPVMQPHPTRLADGNIFLVLTKELEEQRNYELRGLQLTGDAPAPDSFYACNDPLAHSLYMTSLECFIENEKNYIGKSNQIFFDQYMATVLSYLGEEQKARQIFDRINTSIPPQDKIDTSTYQLKNARDEIVNRVKNRQILLINEAHHIPQTRLLTLQLLKPLYDQGYRYLAAESFNEQTLQRTIQRGFPTQETGYYTAEPTYSLIVREALKLGFKLVAYDAFPKCDPFNEAPEKCQNLREEAQAKNLFEHVFKKDPNAKIIIHVGYGHLDKKGGDNDWPWVPMAKYLWQLTKIEPFSVDQTFFFEKGESKLNSALYEQVSTTYNLKIPSVLIGRDTNTPFVYSKYVSHYDMQVFLPKLSYNSNRPSWKSDLPLVKDIVFKSFQCPQDHQCLLQAVFKKESKEAFVPIDQVVVKNSKTKLFLTPGSYILRMVDEQDQVLKVRNFLMK